MTGAQIAARAATRTSIIAPRSSRDRWYDGAFRLLMYGAIAIGTICLAALLVTIVDDGASRVSADLVTNQPSKIRPETAGIQSAILGTLYLMAICAVFVVPVGVATAIYLEEYADRSKWFNRLIEVNIQNLAAVPSVVYGILGLAFIVRGPLGLGPVLLAGAITLGLLVLPVVIIVAREAIRAVPPSIREGAMALGATRWQTIWKQVLPGSIAGIATGVILALSRAIGETAPLIVIGAAVSPRFNPDGLLSSFTALPIQIFSFSKDNDPSFLALAAATIIVLMVILLAMNSVAIYLRNRYEQKW
jgi:phosphate transport system permease protein